MVPIHVLLFLAALLCYVALAAFARPASRLSRVNFLLGNTLLLLALAFNWRAFGGTPPFKPLVIIAAMFCGQLLYMFAVLATKLSIREAVSAAIPSANIMTSCRRRPLLLVQCFFVATYEEFLWRATAQRFLGHLLTNPAVVILIIACLFTLLHQKKFTHDVERAEFLVFSAILGSIYYLTSSLLFVVMVHAIRDINIKCKAPETEQETIDEPSRFMPSVKTEREPAAGDVTGDTE